MNFLYSIMPLDTDHVDEICEDIFWQVENGVTTLPLFMIKLVPEGNPLINKAEIECRKLDLFREKLANYGIDVGVLVQCTLGHGYKLNSPANLTNYINLKDGEKTTVYCPLDTNFQEFMKEQFKIIANHKPKAIMIDDDFRLIGRKGKGCACHLHLKRFNDMAGTNYTREELYNALLSEKDLEVKPLNQIYFEIEKQSLIECVTKFREGLDSVDPSIQGIICHSKDQITEVARIFAGKNNPSIVRLNSGFYCGHGLLGSSWISERLATFKKHIKADIYLVEADTCPHNRYSTSAHNLHFQQIMAICEGVKGAKRWITKLNNFEPESGKAYRKMLAKFAKQYDALEKIYPSVKWKGFKHPISNNNYKFIEDDMGYDGFTNGVLDFLGLPFYYSSESGGITCVDNDCTKTFSRQEIEKWFNGKVLLSSGACQAVNNMGFNEYTGVNVSNHNGENPSGELYISGEISNIQYNIKRLELADKSSQALTTVYHLKDEKEKIPLFAGVSKFKNSLGGTTYVTSGQALAPYQYTTAFGMLNMPRKKLFTQMLEDAGELPVFYPEDAPVTIKAGVLDNGEYLVIFTLLTTDYLDEIPLTVDREVKTVKLLNENGEKVKVDFETINGVCYIKTNAYALEPKIIIIN